MLYRSPLLDQIDHQLRGNETFITRSNGEKVDKIRYREGLDYFSFQISGKLNRGETFGVWIENEVCFSQIVIAGMRSGGIAVLLDPESGSKMVQDQIQEAQISKIFIEGKIYDAFYLTRKEFLHYPVEYIILGMSIFGLQKRKISSRISQITLPQRIPLHGNQSCIIVFTGGTTDKAKGVVHTHDSLLQSAKLLSNLFSGVERMYVDLPHFLLFGILLGISLVTGKNRYSSKKVFRIIEKYKVDSYFSPPYRYNYALSTGKVPSCLKYIFLGSAPVYYGFLSRLISLLNSDQKIFCVYGMTEVLPIAFIDGKEKLAYGSVQGDILGRVYRDVQIEVKEDEFYVDGSHKSYRYLGRSPHEFIATGDCGYISNGLLIMMGRKKDMIIRREYNIYPTLYESILSKIPGVEEVAFIGVFDETISDERVYLFLDLSEIAYSKVEIRNMLKKGRYSIDAYAMPDDIHFMKLPKKGRQKKVDKEYLRNFAKELLSGK